MKALKALAFLTALALTPLSGSAPAQQKDSATEPTGLVLELTHYADRPPSYLPVPPPGSEPKGAWHTSFRRLAGWQPLEGALPVRAVNVLSRKESDGVRIHVSVFLGVKHHEKEEPVASYLLQEHDRVKVNELARFGVQPFEVAVVRVSPIFSPVPPVVNKTGSIEVASVEPNRSTLPSYKLSLRNLSGKSVVAVQIDLLVDDVPRLLSLPEGREGGPLIEAGGLFQTNMPAARKPAETRQGYMPDVPRNQSILIGAAVFEDGSFEGDAKVAAQVRAGRAGQKAQLAQLVDILRKAAEEKGEEKGSDDSALLERLRKDISSLRVEADREVLERLSADVPDLDKSTREWIEVSYEGWLHRVRQAALEAFDKFKGSLANGPEKDALKSWLNASVDRYGRWLSRL
ncbi:MAG TPA: hypothetical protein VE262_11160 [Blastocatellia bacterium]|nr:hypothetical protein [Blastocatellia bacterium]